MHEATKRDERIATPPSNLVRGWYAGGKREETRVRYMAQSILTYWFDKPEPPTYNEAKDIVKWAYPAMQ